MKFLFKIVVLPLAVAAGCASCIKVDHDYNLNRYDSDEETFGDEFVAPLGRIEADVDELLPMDEILESVGVTRDEFERVHIVVPSELINGEFELTCPMNVKLDPDMLHALSAAGEIKIAAELESMLDINSKVFVSFATDSGEVNLELGADGSYNMGAGTPDRSVSSKAEFTVSAGDLESVASSDSVTLRFVRTDAADAVLYVNSRINIRFTIYKTGGIKL